MAMTMTTTLKLDFEIKNRIKHLAEVRHRSAHWMMLEAIREYVEREEKREQFRQAAITSWNNYQQTGQHATAEEADAWLAQLEAGQDTEPPECHN